MSSYKIRIYYEDTDVGGIVYHANYIKYCERARSEMFFTSNIPITSDGCHFVVSQMEVKYLKPTFLSDELEVKTKTLKLKKASCVLRQDIYKNDELVFTANITIVYTKNGKILKMPEYLVKFFIQKV